MGKTGARRSRRRRNWTLPTKPNDNKTDKKTGKQQTKEDEKHHTPDTLERQIEKWMGGEDIALQKKHKKPRPRITGTNKKDTTHNSSSYQDKKEKEKTDKTGKSRRRNWTLPTKPNAATTTGRKKRKKR